MKTKNFKMTLIAFITAILMGILSSLFMGYKDESPMVTLEDVWTVSYNGYVYDNIDISNRAALSNIIGDGIPKGKSITIKTTLPDIGDLNFPTLMVYTHFCAFTIAEKNVPIESIFMDEYEKNKPVGSVYSFIPIDKDYAGETITITFYAGEDDPFEILYSPVLGDYRDVKTGFIQSNLFPLLTGVFMIIFGGAFLIVAFIFFPSMPEFKSQIFSSLFSLDMGIWTICYFKLASLFSDYRYVSNLEYASLFLLVPISFMLFDSITSTRKLFLYRAFTWLSTGLVVLFLILHFANIVHMKETLKYIHILGLVIIIYVFIYRFKYHSKDDITASDSIIMQGFSVLGIVLIIDIIIHQIYWLPSMQLIRPERFILPLGVLFNAFCLLINYYLYISESFARKKEYASLTHLAYADGLTNLANRSRSDKYLHDLDLSNEDYTLISLDLNGLKEVNDEKGHSCGDKYLIEFAHVMQDSMVSNDFCARIGGDEFIVITKITDHREIDNYIDRMRDRLNSLNVSDPEYFRSVAAGYASKNELPEGNSHDVYLLADTRMYQNKRDMHKQFGHEARI